MRLDALQELQHAAGRCARWDHTAQTVGMLQSGLALALKAERQQRIDPSALIQTPGRVGSCSGFVLRLCACVCPFAHTHALCLFETMQHLCWGIEH